MLSSAISIRTSDGHGIYDKDSGDLLNAPKPIVLGKHIWLGQGVIVGKGTTIGDDCILGAKSYATGQDIPPNTLSAGTPARVLRENVTWGRRMVDNFYAEGAEVDRHSPIDDKKRSIASRIMSAAFS
ncbi:acyltransferase [Falsihalocynthiibacter sp. SS001]|uniref:acyltransferase n=1 Tax=Falsihalocynthiibacter sp. SS001 TaxID=3349698 RepID=UPI0036D25FD8